MNQVAEKTISWSATVYSNKLSSQCNLTAQIEPAQDKMYDLTPIKSTSHSVYDLGYYLFII